MAQRSIRWHLYQVLLLCVLPVGLFAGALLYLHWQAQERQRAHSQIESVRLLAAAIDNALDSSVQRLSILARLWAANPSSDALIHAQARAALPANPDWSGILAFRADGSPVFRTEEAFGAPLRAMRLIDSWKPVLEGRSGGMVTDVMTAPYRGNKVVAVGVPVVRDGKVTHVLIASLKLSWFDQLVARQGVGDGGIAGIFDRNWKFLARSADGDARRGTDPSGPLIDDMKRAPEGIGRYTSLDGSGVYTSWAPTRHGWWVALATAAAPIEGAFWNYLAVLGLLWVAMVAAGVAYAIAKGHHIAQALESVEAHGAALADARALTHLPQSRVKEVSRALDALEQASARLQAAMLERDRSLMFEQKARGAAEAANRAKDEFLAMLGHELRNPLAAISSAATILRNPGRTEKQLEFAAGVVERQSRHLKRLLDDLLDVGRVMSGKVMLERATVDLAAAVRHVADTLESAGRFAQRRVALELNPAWVDGDVTRVEQIATNLLVNAVKYTAAGGSIRVRVARDGEDAVIEVSDDGRGIEAANLERVFELFFQGDSGVERAAGGLGIGLTIVRRLAELHGGTVTARSGGPGKGTTVSVRLPAMASAPLAEAAASVLGGSLAHAVLVVEDNDDERESLRLALELQGQSVLHAPDGHAALELLRRFRPPAAILDIGLPGMNGYEVARAARALQGADILLIALTGYGSAADKQRARAAGFDHHFSKPVEISELMRVLANQRGLSADQKIA